MSTTKNEQYHILSPEWLAKNGLPDDAEFLSGTGKWVRSSFQGKTVPRELNGMVFRTARTDLPPEAYSTPLTDTTGSGREGEPSMSRAILLFLENEVEMPDVQRRMIADELAEFLKRAGFGLVEALRRDGDESAEWSEILPEESGYWWHWSGHEDDAPFMHYIMWSGTVNKYFVSANTIPETPWVEDVGGYWIKATVPRAAIDSAQRQEAE